MMELIFRRVKVVWTFRCLPVISQFLVKLPRLGFQIRLVAVAARVNSHFHHPIS